MKFIGRIISDGRVTIPEQIRKLLGLKSGDYVSCEIEGIPSPIDRPPLDPDTKTGEQTGSN